MARTYWDILTADGNRKFPESFRAVLEENRGLFDTSRRAAPEVREIPWKETGKSLNKLHKMTKELHQKLAFIDFDVYRTLFVDRKRKKENDEIRKKFQEITNSLSQLQSMLEAGQKTHKSANEFTKKKMDREYLKIIFDYTNRAYYTYTREEILPEKTLPPLWLVAYIVSIDSYFGKTSNLIEQAFSEWREETAPAAAEIPEVNSVYRLGSRYIVVGEIFDSGDAVAAYIQDDLRGCGDFHDEILIEDLALMERLPVSPAQDLET